MKRHIVLAAVAVTVLTAGGIALAAAPTTVDTPSFARDTLAYCQQLRVIATTSAQRTRADNCIRDAEAVIALEATPTPGPSPSASPTSGASPTVAPSPTRATPPPTPRPSTTRTTGCMPVPSACGYPDATNTGPTGPLAIVQGNVRLTTDGQVYANRDVRGCLTIDAKNVVVRNVKVTCNGWYAIAIHPWSNTDANALIVDVEIDAAGQFDGKGIAFSGYTARRVHYHGGADCFHLGDNVTIEDSFCTLGPDNASADFCSGPEHIDGVQSDGGGNYITRHNTIRNPCDETAAILMSTNTSPIHGPVIIDDNLMAGGGWTVYCGTGAGGPVLGRLEFTNNRIARAYWPKGGYYGPTSSCNGVAVNTGNRWDEGGAL